jgi:drug/metabolite transporter (DMT)-like permease
MASVFGAVFFGENPQPNAVLGWAVIIGAALFMWWRGPAPEPAKPDL